MGHGDIKLMRGVGAFLGPALTAAATGIGVLLGLVVGVLALAVASRRSKGAGAEGLPEEMAYAPESFGSLLKLGVWYLLALDVVGVVFPGVYRLIGEDPPPRGLEEDDNWQPSLTTIPFGPYLAAGALVCMIFAAPILVGINLYIERNFGP
jgi:leader peptidase (prepilin peptidase)/N-methyltransferase